MTAEIIGILIEKIKIEFELNETMVYIGPQNIEHIRNKHPEDYETYFEYISEIISSPDYFGKNLKDESIELIKEFEISEKVYVKVAVRISKKGKLFARTLYKLTDTERFEYQLSKGFYKKIEKT
ncbi:MULTISPECIES: PBECR2 nuclease fold domain-containing protein [Fusobacterium]|uniref:Transposase n=1 Tax=Fusobacterium animalis TaxID=76859 RepID=A0A2B7YPR9_9FUSO|nr:PBECR2 nuclease fold domain-containing protein [Fusobacterium animalis]PGH23295.1 transposase [Fusobacterium animalis]